MDPCLNIDLLDVERLVDDWAVARSFTDGRW
jgi:hypothetical protein